MHDETFGIQCFPSVTASMVPDTMTALSFPLSSGMELLEFLFDNDFHQDFHRFSLDSLSLSKDVFSFFVTGSSTSSLEWNRDGHPQYSHLLIVSNKQRALFNA